MTHSIIKRHQMTICFVTIGDITSIATLKRALGMANPLQSMGWEVSIIAMDCPENRKRIGSECNSNVRAYYYQPGKALAEINEKTLLVKKINPQYINLCSYSYRNRLYKTRLNGKPKIIIEHSELPSGIPDYNGIKKVGAYFFEYLSIIYADFLICASKYLINTYQKRSSQVFKSDIPMLYSPYAFNKESLRKIQAGLPPLRGPYGKDTIILYMGTMTRNYGLFAMIDAMKIVKGESDGVKLLLMGRGRHLAEAKAYVSENNLQDCVEFLGYVPEAEIDIYFNRADAFISPLKDTVQDNARCPSKIYMYLPFRKPVFTCKIGEPKEIFGNNGFYFQYERPDTLAQLILDLKSGNLRKVNIPIEEHSWNNRSIAFHRWITDQEA
jgi:glycosyltransferase involved in cell wall biosynthesis